MSVDTATDALVALEERVTRLEADNDSLRSVLRMAGRLLADGELLQASDAQEGARR